MPEWMHPALSELERAVRDDKVAHKNTAILLEAQVAVRRLCGGRVTFCKSGKVRGRAYTLERCYLFFIFLSLLVLVLAFGRKRVDRTEGVNT